MGRHLSSFLYSQVHDSDSLSKFFYSILLCFFNGKFKWQSSELRELWERAGVHLYNNTDDVFYIGRNWLSIHTVDGGERTLRFPFYAEVIDPLKGQVLADSTNSSNINLSPKSTRLLRIIPKKMSTRVD